MFYIYKICLCLKLYYPLPKKTIENSAAKVAAECINLRVHIVGPVGPVGS